MPKQTIIGLSLLSLLVAGCAGGGVTVRRYVEDRPRIDQKLTGNQGYIMGTPKPQERGADRRKVFVLEVTKEADDANLAVSKPKAAPRQAAPVMEEPVYQAPMTQSERVSAPLAASFEEYTVQSGDTLQKISKKYYDTYRKWPKIYDANKDVISDPNRLKKGVTLKIPLDGASGRYSEPNLK